MTNQNGSTKQKNRIENYHVLFFVIKYVGRILLENIKKFDVHSEKLQQNIEKGMLVLRY